MTSQAPKGPQEPSVWRNFLCDTVRWHTWTRWYYEGAKEAWPHTRTQARSCRACNFARVRAL